MKTFRSLASWLLCLVLLAGLLPAGAAGAYTPGTYSKTIPGHNAPMTIKVTFSEDKITDINTEENLETIGVGALALKELSEEILASQSLGVDAIAGATVTSLTFLAAVKDCVKQADGDVDALGKVEVKKAEVLPEYSADVVVVGAGGAGLAAAISAAQQGASVVVVEKLGIVGGSTNVSEGALNAVDEKRQSAQGIEDSVEKFYQQTMEGGHNAGTPELVKYMTENAMGAVEWMESLGVSFKDEVGTATGALWQRSHYPSTPSGNSYIRVFMDRIREMDKVTLLMNTPAKSLVRNDDGRVSAVICENGGKEVKVSASKGVIIATGGFGANVELRNEVNTGVWAEVKLDDSIGCTNMNASAQGDGIVMAEAVGAAVTGMPDIQIHPCGHPKTGLMVDIRTSGRNRIFVNQSGARFVNEGAARDALCKAIFAQPDSTYWIVVNHLRYPSRDFVDRNGATIANMVAQGNVIEADSLEKLAELTGMDAKALQASIDQYNSVVRKEMEKDEFGFEANNKDDKEMTEGPWYACRKVPSVHHTMGGLKINVDTQVLDKDDQVIPGLFAAGEVTGGIHGTNRLGGNAIADCMVFGHKAGLEAAK